ncbi:HPr kinase/phosphorylase [Mycoplasmopsis meleagridis]|uniref:HPr(Ser) kinase/phosphatase n=1 Tax=Mycoplasmopsis meleagridis TaxID=29561 RepID=UPI0007C24235|nr:HPr(Ser) kinase/phosphatase [Mycoplasmopsis meleagridis]OAD18127.1 HPr kinase/phosphorylase [Mycoplasmopsis meleagridis]VEU77291.1 HPr kinase/phosphorylase [Mycoplasmopsis meleagridis]
MSQKKFINVRKLIDKFHIDIVNKNSDLAYRDILDPDIKQIGLELAGEINNTNFHKNVICWGTTESKYFAKLGKEEAHRAIDNVLQYKPPLLILSKGVKNLYKNWVVNVANKYQVPIYCPDSSTATIVTTIGTYLTDFFSKEEQVHGCLVSVAGTGVLIVGKSGVGKSEAVLDLIQRGHVFISDDAVLIKHIGSNFYGTSPELTKNFIEVRGIGLIDVKYTYGIKAIADGAVIDLVVELVVPEGQQFDRLGIEYLRYKILDGSIVKTQIPIRNGFSAASLIEAAVSTFLARKEGFSVLDQIEKRKQVVDE